MNELNKEEIGQRIKALRTQNGLTMEQFGEIFEPPASKSIVSRWEKGKSIPSNERIQKIADEYNISTFYLLYGKAISKDVFNKNVPVDNIKLDIQNLQKNTAEDAIFRLKNCLEQDSLSLDQKQFIAVSFIFLETNKDEELLYTLSRLIATLGSYNVASENVDTFGEILYSKKVEKALKKLNELFDITINSKD